LETKEDKDDISKKFLKIYLYASTKIRGANKLYQWLLKGSLPQSTSSGSDSMALLNHNAKKINTLNKNRNKAIDKLGKTRDQLTKKSTKKLEDDLSKGNEKLTLLESLFSSQKEQIESIILDIETSLGSGRKL
jgi:hypothetical protein